MNGKGSLSEMKSPSNAVLPTLRTPNSASVPVCSTATLSRTQHIFRTPLSTLSEQNNTPSSSPSPAPSTASPPNTQPNTILSEECRIPECGPVYSINNGSEGDTSFNSNCKQCVAERAAASYGGTLKPRVEDESEEIEERRPPREILTPEPPGRTYECELWCRESSKLLAGFLGIFVLAVSYAALGGFVFMVIELRASRAQEGLMLASESKSHPNISHLIPKDVQESLDRARIQTVNKLWKVTEEMNILYPKNWTRKAAEEIIWFQNLLTNELTRELRSIADKAERSRSAEDPVLRPMRSREWTFARGMLYSVSLLTTVGSGMDWAMSPLSRALSVVYILIGIPIMYLYLSTSGELFSKALTFLSSRAHLFICRRRRGPHGSGHTGSIIFRSQRSGSVILSNSGSCKRSSSQTPFYSSSTERISLTPTLRSLQEEQMQQMQVPPHILVPILGVALLLLAYILLGASLVSSAQGWNFREGFYFSFLSMSTVGFGGVRPEDDSTRDLWPCVAYIFLGATVTSTSLYLLHDHVLKRRRREAATTKTRSKSKAPVDNY